MFSYDAAYLDRALRVRILGKEAIGNYLSRVLGSIPYGKGAKLMHVVGSDGSSGRTREAP